MLHSLPTIKVKVVIVYIVRLILTCEKVNHVPSQHRAFMAEHKAKHILSNKTKTTTKQNTCSNGPE